MEYEHYLSLVSRYLPPSYSQYPQFAQYLRSNPTLLFEYADNLVMTLPSPRTKYYEAVNFDDT